MVTDLHASASVHHFRYSTRNSFARAVDVHVLYLRRKLITRYLKHSGARVQRGRKICIMQMRFDYTAKLINV